jgi:hypothetical protein
MSRHSLPNNAQLRCEPLEARYLLVGDFLADMLPVPDGSMAEQVLTDLIDQNDWSPNWWDNGWNTGQGQSESAVENETGGDWQQGDVDQTYFGSDEGASTETTGYPDGGWAGDNGYANMRYPHPSDVWLPFEGTNSGVTLVEPRFGQEPGDESLTAIRSTRDGAAPTLTELEGAQNDDPLASGLLPSGSSQEQFSELLGDEDEVLASLAGTHATDLLGAASAEETVTVFDLEADPTLAPIAHGEALADADAAADDSVATRLGPDLLSILTQSTDADDAADRLAEFFDELIEAAYQFGNEMETLTTQPVANESDLPRFEAEGSLGAAQERDRTRVDIVHATAHAAALLAGLSLVLQSREYGAICQRPLTRDDS